MEFIKKRKKDILINLVFIITHVVILFIITKGFKLVLASKTDFSIQHYMIPDFFRLNFYKTFDLFPDFAFNLGAGQNIYYLSYYGLLNPIFLLSYLFPMIKMLDFTIFIVSFSVILSTSLFYFYLRKNGYSYLISFLSSYMFLLSAPLIFHCHRHIMFIDYLPFLILGLYGIDKYIKENKSFLLMTSVILMILTSYYFSISGMIVLFIYGILKYIKENKNEKFLKFFINFSLRFVISVMISSVLTIPTLYVLFNGRTDTIDSLNMINLFKPEMYMLYNSYSIGLTIISFISVIFMLFYKKSENKLLSFILLLVSIFPIFNYILNGFLYINAKSLIPFIPLVLINTSDFLKIIFKKKIVMILVSIYIVISSFVICLNVNMKDKLIEKKDVDNEYDKHINKILEDDDFYRINGSLAGITYINRVSNIDEYKTTMYSSTYNNNYKNIYTKLFNNPLSYRNKFMLASSDNILFQMYMGEKYIVSKEDYSFIYEKIDEYKDLKIYKNPYVLPIGYSSSKIINKKDFEKLSYPDNVINLLRNIVVDSNTNSDIINLKKEELKYNVLEKENIKIDTNGQGYKIDASKHASLRLDINENLENKLLLINFDIEDSSCRKGDLSIIINGQANKLTCKEWKYYNENKNFNYVVLNDDKLDIKFDKGIYNIKNINIYKLDFDLIKDINKKIDKFNIDKSKTKGDIIVGNINVSNDSYFTISIPYDKGFKTYIDGKLVDNFEVNGSFIGFKIEKGNHEVKIVYEAPLKNICLIISFIGLIIYFIIIIKEEVCFMKILKKYKEIIMYLIFGVLTTGINILTYTLLTNLVHMNWKIGNIIAWILSVLFAYITNKKYVFNSENKNILKELVSFFSVRLVSFILDMALMLLLIDLMSINNTISKIIVQVVVIIVNYLFSKLWVFKN